MVLPLNPLGRFLNRFLLRFFSQHTKRKTPIQARLITRSIVYEKQSPMKGAHTHHFAPRIGAIRRYISAIFSQGLMSGFHFVLNLSLVKLLPVKDFGIYSLTFVLAIMLTAIVSALLSTPLVVYAPAATATERGHVESMLTTLTCFFLGICIALGLLISLGIHTAGIDFSILVAGLIFITTYLARQYSRNFGYARFDVTTVMAGDILYVVCGATLFALLYLTGSRITVVGVFASLSLGNLLAIMIEIARHPDVPSLLPLRRTLVGYKPIWKQSRWALIGAVTTIMLSQAHSLVVTTLKGPVAYAPLAAGFVLFGPIRIIFMTIQNVLKPEMALAIAQQRYQDARRQMLLASGASLAAVAGLTTLILLFWPLVEKWLYADRYGNAPMRTIVLLWAAVTLAASIQNGPSSALQSFKAFRPLAMITVYGSALSLTLVVLLLSIAPVYWSICGILCAEAFAAVFELKLCLTRFRETPTPPPDP